MFKYSYLRCWWHIEAIHCIAEHTDISGSEGLSNSNNAYSGYIFCCRLQVKNTDSCPVYCHGDSSINMDKYGNMFRTHFNHFIFLILGVKQTHRPLAHPQRHKHTYAQPFGNNREQVKAFKTEANGWKWKPLLKRKKKQPLEMDNL